MAKIDDTLAHGHAHHLLRQLMEDCRRRADRVFADLEDELGRKTVRKAKARQIVARARRDLGDDVMAEYQIETKRDGPIAVWIVPGAAGREGLVLIRLILWFVGPRHVPEFIPQPLIFVSDHTLARMLQRIPDAEPETLMSHAREIALGACLARTLVEAHGWKQWCIPVGEGSIVGTVDENGMLESRTYLPDDKTSWSRIRESMEVTLMALDHTPSLRGLVLVGAKAADSTVMMELADRFDGDSFMRLHFPHGREDAPDSQVVEERFDD